MNFIPRFLSSNNIEILPVGLFAKTTKLYLLYVKNVWYGCQHYPKRGREAGGGGGSARADFELL